MDRFVGKRLDGRYEIQEIIGVGGMAVVYKAYDNVEDRIVAIKILKEEFVSNEEFIRRFKNESKAIAVLSHPNIVKVFDVSFGDLIQYIVMEYIDGITLKEYIERQGSLKWKDAVFFAIQILKGLQHAHDKGIVHRDVKPQNIMVLSDGSIKVTDFGIARFARNEQLTITDKAIGSVHYISPEQARGEKTDEKADIYSVGVMLYEMLTGSLPFEAESAVSVAIMQLQRDPKLPSEVNPSVPLGLEQITMHAMQKSAERRYQSAAEMLCDLDKFKKDPSATFEYSYFVDDSPTKFVGSLSSSTPASEVDDIDEFDSVEDVKEKNNMIPILSGIAAALVIAIIVLAIIFVPRLFKSTGKEIEYPNFVGMSMDEVKDSDEYDNFVIEWDYVSNDEHEIGIVCEQSQDAGKPAKKGAKITLFVSMGQSTVKVPDVYGKAESYAVSELKSKGFTTIIKETADDEVEKGLVIKTDPACTTVVAEGAEITVYVSTGKATKMVDVPNVVGLTKEKAKTDIEKLDLVVKIENRDLTSKDKFYKEGYVISQTPDANSSAQVEEGTTITIYVSTGVVNYNFDLSINEIPTNFVNSSTTISLWVDGKLFKESEKIDLTSISSYTFKGLSTTDENIVADVKFSDGEIYHRFMKISINTENGSYNILSKDKNYPTQETKPTQTPSDTSSNNNPSNSSNSEQSNSEQSSSGQ